MARKKSCPNTTKKKAETPPWHHLALAMWKILVANLPMTITAIAYAIAAAIRG